jgi:hypothetical protein
LPSNKGTQISFLQSFALHVLEFGEALLFFFAFNQNELENVPLSVAVALDGSTANR